MSTSFDEAGSKGELNFRIVDNVLVGADAPVNRECINIGKLILERMASNRELVGQVDAMTDKQSTFGEMRDRSVKCALWLKKQGVQLGDVVGICTDNHLDAYTPLLASLYIAVPCNPWDHDLSIQSSHYFLSIASPKVIFMNAEYANNMAQAVREKNLNTKIVTFGQLPGFESVDDIVASQEGANINEFRCTELKSPDDVATIICSSGTTGLPKGTEISHSSLINYINLIEIHNLTGHVSMWTPTYRWHYGLSLALRAILTGSKRIIVPDFDDDVAFCQFIDKYKVSWLGTDPCLPVRMLKYDVLPKYRLPTLRILLTGGSHFKPELQKIVCEMLPHTLITQSYGMTDLGGMVTYQHRKCKPGSSGVVSRNIRLKIVDLKTGETLGANQTGEIWVQSPYMMNGYHKNPEATKKMVDENGWLHSGDLGYYDEDGELFIVDRLSEFINYKGITVSPAEIEGLLESHPSVLKASVVGVPNDVYEEYPMGFIIKVPGREVTEQELMELVEKELPDHCKLRAGLKIVDDLPRTATGKVFKKELKEIARKIYVP